MTLTTTAEHVELAVPLTVLSLEGELDASNFERLITEVQGLYQGGSRHLLLDLSGLTFIASSGLIALHSIVRIMHGEAPADLEAGWGAFHSMGHEVASGAVQTEVQLAGAQAPIARVLERTGLDRIFVIHADRATAIAAS